MNGSEKIFTDYIDEKGVKRRAEVLPPEVLGIHNRFQQILERIKGKDQNIIYARF